MQLRTLSIVIVLAVLPFSGCVQNMADLKERLGATAEEPVTPNAVTSEVTPTPVVNATKVTKPPVARISAFGANGALLFKSSFQADDPADVLYVPNASKISLIGSDSEALEAGAKIASYAWTMNGAPAGDQKQATVEVGGAGIYAVQLVVTDSLGKSDNHTLKLGVAPQPFDVVTTLTTPPVNGVLGLPEAAAVVFELKLADAKVPAKIQAMKVVASPASTCDIALEVLDAEGESLGTANGSDATTSSQEETVELAEVAEGAYTIEVGPEACASQDGVPLTITVTYLPIIEGLGGDDHGGHAGH